MVVEYSLWLMVLDIEKASKVGRQVSDAFVSRDDQSVDFAESKQDSRGSSLSLLIHE
jgi:hypothetical protein